MTTYTLRKGSPAKTRTDLVVIGVAKTGKGDLVAVPGGRGRGVGVRPQVQAACSARWVSAARRARCCASRPVARSRPASCSSSASVTATPSPSSGYAAPQVWPPATSATPRRSRWPSRPTTPSTCAPSPTGSSRAPTPSSSTSRSPTTPVSRTSPSSATPPAARTRSRRWTTAKTVAEVVQRARDWVNTPPNDLTPELFADGVLSLRQAAHRPVQAEARDRGPGTRRAGRARLRRDPRCRDGLVEPASPGQADLGPRGRAGEGRIRRQGRHLRLGRPDHQARQLDGDDEVRHGWRGRSDRGDLRHRRARAARGRDHLRADGGEHGRPAPRCVPATC